MNQTSEPTILRRGLERKELPDLAFLKECFEVTPETKGLTWKTRPISHFLNPDRSVQWNARFAGQDAGSKCCRPNGDRRYREVGLLVPGATKVTLFSVHLIVWKMMGNEATGNREINHIDHDPWNNSPDNLECVTPHENQQRTKPTPVRSKTSGLPKGVFRDKTSYGARIIRNGRKFFLGNFSDPKDAEIVYKAAEEEWNENKSVTTARRISKGPKKVLFRKLIKAHALPRLEYLKEALTLNPETGEFTWRSDRPRHHFNSDRGMNISNSSYGGKTAGVKRADGYTIICIGGQKIYAQRLVWIFTHGADPGHLWVDHMNQDPSDNRPGNLQLLTNQENSFNSGKRQCKQYELSRGVQRHLNGLFEANLRHNGVLHRLGTFSTQEEAVAARRRKAEELCVPGFVS